MGASPRWKVYTAEGEYRAACKFPEDAGAIVAILPNGATIRDGHGKQWTVWTEGRDGQAGESYDFVAERCHANADAVRVVLAKRLIRQRGFRRKGGGR